MPDSPELVAYTKKLRRLTEHVDPTVENPVAEEIRRFTGSLERLTLLGDETLIEWVRENPQGVYTLALAVGLSKEKLKNLVRQQFGTMSWVKAAREDPAGVVAWLTHEYDLVSILRKQLGRTYSFGDVLAGRASSQQTAERAGTAGRLIEDQVEVVVRDLGLPFVMRSRFVGVNRRTGPADIIIPDPENCEIAVACKGFDSTGSKLTAAVNEITEMVDVHRPSQFLMAVVDGIGWHSRMSDFRRMFEHFEENRIEGLYTLSDLDRFRTDLERAARIRGLLT